MSTFEEDLLADAENDRQAIAFIRTHLPQELKDKFSDEELYYFLDVICEFYSGIVEEQEKSGSSEVDIDIEGVATHIAKQAKKDQMGDYDVEDLRWIVDAELDFAETQWGEDEEE